MSRTQRFLFWLAALAAFVLLIHLLKPILLPFIAGLGVAYLLDPIADKLEEKGLSRVLATALITVVFFSLVIGIILLMAPLLQSQIAGIAQRLPEFIDLIQRFATDSVGKVKALLPVDTLDAGKNLGSDVAGSIGNAVREVLQRLWAGGKAIFGLFSVAIITPVVSFYMLLKWDDIVDQVDDLLPRHHADTIREQAREIDRTLSGFIRGQASVCLTLAVIYGVSLSVVGLEAGLLIGLAAGIISFVPYIGAVSGVCMALGVALVQFDTWLPILMVIGVFGVGQLLESYVLTPRMVGDRVGLHDLWIIFAVMAGGALFGFVGVLLAVPTAAVIGVLVRFSLNRYQDSALYLGDEADNKSSSP